MTAIINALWGKKIEMLEKCGKGRFKLNNPIYSRKEKGVENTTDSQDDKNNF